MKLQPITMESSACAELAAEPDADAWLPEVLLLDEDELLQPTNNARAASIPTSASARSFLLAFMFQFLPKTSVIAWACKRRQHKPHTFAKMVMVSGWFLLSRTVPPRREKALGTSIRPSNDEHIVCVVDRILAARRRSCAAGLLADGSCEVLVLPRKPSPSGCWAPHPNHSCGTARDSHPLPYSPWQFVSNSRALHIVDSIQLLNMVVGEKRIERCRWLLEN